MIILTIMKLRRIFAVLICVLATLILLFVLFYKSQLPKDDITKYPDYVDIESALENSKRVYKLELLDTSDVVAVEDLLKLKKMQNLHIYGRLNLDTFPGDLVRLRNLKFVTICNNDISSIDYKVQYFKHLKLLDLSNNEICEFPYWICFVESLQTLDLSNNRIVEIPKDIYEMENLISLNLSGNKLQDIPYSIGNLKNLRFLYLHNNDLRELPKTLSDLYMNLSYLSIGGNDISVEDYLWLVENLPYTEIDTLK